jgi:4-hydroxy-tetrahydrodipicolinate synthase
LALSSFLLAHFSFFACARLIEEHIFLEFPLSFYRGLWVALITPFSGGRLDEASLRRIIGDLRLSGVNGFVPVGTTGEGVTLSDGERRRVIEICLEEAGNIPVAPNTGTYSTEETIRRTVEVAKMGAQGAMVITPYYNKPTQEGLLAHFRAVARATELPLMLYNIPSRTGINLEPATLVKMAELPTIVAIKEASASIQQISDIHARLGDRIEILSGDDGFTLPILAVGGCGAVSVAGHIVPDLMLDLISSHKKGDNARALECHEKLMPLCKALFMETSPAPAKCAMAMLGKCSEDVRLPLVTVKESTRKEIRAALEALGKSVSGSAGVY